MEESLQNLLITIYDESYDFEESIIPSLYKLSFNPTLTHSQKIFLSSRLIQSDLNLFQFILNYSLNTDRKVTSIRAKIIDFLKEFIIYYQNYIIDYLINIKNKIDSIFDIDKSQVIKEKILNLNSKILLNINDNIIYEIYKPKEYLLSLLDNIKKIRMSNIIKTSMYYLISILIKKYSNELNDFKLEIHEIIYNDFLQILNEKKFELKALTYILKSYKNLLEDPYLKTNQIEMLYHYIKSLINPLKDANSIKINKLALEIISEFGKVFSKQLQNESIELFDLVFSLCTNSNNELKIAANIAIEKICIHIS